MDIKNNIYDENHIFELKDGALFCVETTYYCKMRCSYCYQNHLRNLPKKYISPNYLKKILNKIIMEKDKNKDLKFIRFNIQGGEIFDIDDKYPIELLNIIKSITRKDIKISFLTNFSFKLEKFLDIFKEIFKNDQNKELLITIHPNLLLIKSPKLIIEEIKTLYKNNIKIDIQFFEHFQNKKIFFIANEIEKIKQDLTDIKILNQKFFMNSNYNCLCFAKEYNINPDGIIKDVCRNKSFNIINFKFINTPISCNIKNCKVFEKFRDHYKIFLNKKDN